MKKKGGHGKLDRKKPAEIEKIVKSYKIIEGK